MTRVIPTTALALYKRLSTAFLLSLVLTLPHPAVAQTTPPPTLVPTQTLTPTDAEIGSPARQIGFGSAIAVEHDTAMISETAYMPNAGRIALFKKDASGQWLRDGSIDPDSTPGVYGPAYAFGLGIALRDDYALIMSTTANYLYHKVHGQWTLSDMVTGICCYNSTAETIDPPFVFVTNKVYRIGPHGKMQLAQTLVADGYTFDDGLGNEVAESDGTLVISETSDNEDRGALYTFEERHGVWVQTQKIVANDGVPSDELGTDISISGDIIVAAAGGKDYDYVNPACNNNPTSGAVYIFKRIRGVWTQQQEIVNPCLYGFQFNAVAPDWLAILNPGYAFDGQQSGALIYRRENLPRSSGVKFVPYGSINTDGGAYESGAVLHGSQLFSAQYDQYTIPAGEVNVYDLPKGHDAECKDRDEHH